MRWRALGYALCVAAWGAPARAQYACVEGVGVRDGGYDRVAVASLLQMNPRCVHLELRRDVWSGVDDPVRRGSGEDSVLSIHERLIDEYRDGGAEVVLSVGADVVGVTREGLRDAAAREAYARALRAVLVASQGRLLAVEIVDEPNLRDDAGREALDPATYALLVADAQGVIDALRATYGCWLPRLVVGGFATAEGEGAVAPIGTYVREVYDALSRGPRWASLGFPGVVSAHVVRERSVFGERVLSAATRGAVSDLRWALRQRMGEGATLPEAWITRAGWRSDGTAAGNNRQSQEASDLGAVLRAPVDNLPELVSWYAFVDDGAYGLFDGGRIANSARRNTFNVVRSLLGQYRPAYWSRLIFSRERETADPGARVEVVLRGYNAGANSAAAESWTTASGVAVGQAEGCPHAGAINGVRWVDLPDGGTPAPFVLGARVPLVLPGMVGPDGPFTAAWTVEAPSDPGEHVVAARLIRDGQWFGQTATMVLMVRAVDAGAASDVIDVAGDVDAVTDGGSDTAGIDAPTPPEDATVDVTGDLEASASHDVGGDIAPGDVGGVAEAHDDASVVDVPRPPEPAMERGGCGCGAAPVRGPSALALGACALVARRRRPARRRRAA